MPEQNIIDMNDKKFDENAKDTLKSIDQLLTMAEESEKSISINHKYEILILFSLGVCIISYCLIASYLSSVFGIYLFSPNDSSSLVLLTIILAAIAIPLLLQYQEVRRNKEKEEITFKSSLGVVQEILPYYFDKMSVLERTVYKIRLSKLDIVAAEVKPEKNNTSIQN